MSPLRSARAIVMLDTSDGSGSGGGGERLRRLSVQLQRPLGVILEENEEGGGVFVARIVSGGNAWDNARLLRGDRLLAVDEIPVASESLDSVMQTIARSEAETVKLFVERDGS